ncbi:MAG: hypothetical protein J5927_06435 [Oscillospiraceae bacterium]|nr:hypothetical protein [Oscillospiraceae bacterium]
MNPWIKKLLLSAVLLLICLSLIGCDSQVKTLSGVMTPGEIAGLERYKNLQSLDLSGSDCYDDIEAYIASHPQVAVTYTVALGGEAFAPDTRELTLSTPAAVEDLIARSGYLHDLETVTLSGEAAGPETIRRLREALPQLPLDYPLTLLGKTLDPGISSLDLSAITPADIPQAVEVLPMLSQLKTVALPDSLPFSDYAALKAAAPDVDFSYAFTLFGQEADTHTTELAYANVDIGNAGARELYDILPALDKLERISFVDCGIDDDVMDKLRRAFPEKEVVWLVRFGWGQAMSDVDRIWAIGGFNDEQLKPLKYCTKVKYLDLGHNGITKLDFLYYMPDLEVAIFENDYLVDLTALGSCKKLEYLEVGETRVTDVSPLAGCESLEHLNIGGLPLLRDITPLYGLQHLKRLYGLCDVNVPQEQIDTIKELMPDCEVDFQYDPKGAVNGSRWRYTEGGYAERYALLHDQIGYDWLL